MQVFYTNFSDYLALPECPLSSYRRNKLSRITNPEIFRKEVITEFFLLKCLLSVDGSIQRPLNIVTNENGKPYLSGSDLFFSISHCDDLLVIAVDSREIGIDCESNTSNHNYHKIASRYFSANESQSINDYDDFLKIWTKKEAYAKMLGKSAVEVLSQDLTNLANAYHLLKDSYHITICTSQ